MPDQNKKKKREEKGIVLPRQHGFLASPSSRRINVQVDRTWAGDTEARACIRDGTYFD